MSTEIYRDGKYILTFAASFSRGEQKSALKKIEAAGEDVLHRNPYFSFNRPGYEILQLRRSQKRVLNRALQNAEAKLFDIGLETPSRFLPDLRQIEIRRRPQVSQETWGHVDGNRQFLLLEIPIGLGTDLNNISVQSTLYHEIGEFVPRRIIEKRKQKYTSEISYMPIASGFENHRGFNFYKGVYNETLATLFSLFCIDRDVVITTPHNRQLPFMIELFKEYASRIGGSPLDAFKKFFKANAERDFTFQKGLVDLFGTEMVRALNTINYISPLGDIFTQELKQVARMGNFIQNYTFLQRAINRGETITLPGMKGAIKKIPDIEYTKVQ